MDSFNEAAVIDITVMKAARTGGTLAAIDNPIGYFMAMDPGPMLLVQPTLADAKEWSKDHLDTMLRDTQVLAEKFPALKSKDSNILYKRGAGSTLYMIGSNSAGGFRRKTIQRAFLDDLDGYEATAGDEGDQVELARNRTITYTYHQRKICTVSTPTIRGLSRIEARYYESDQRHYYVPCPFCNHKQLLLFNDSSQFKELATSYLRFDKETGGGIHYPCENCKKEIDERYKTGMVRHGEWRKLNPGVVRHAGFHISELISPFSSWAELVADFLKAKRNRETLRVFINQRLGETFVEEKSYEVDEGSLLARLEHYMVPPEPKVPAEVLVMTAGVDVQAERLEVVLVGWGKEFESWLIDRRIIYGSPERASTWEELDAYLAAEYTHERGLRLSAFSTHGLACVCVDSGYSTDAVYAYVKRRQRRRFFATKGEAGGKLPFVIDVKYEKKYQARFARLGVDAIKARIYDRLTLTREADQPYPGGFMHFHDRTNKDFFDQLTAEKRVIVKTPGGYPALRWVLKDNRRNEVLDCYALNIAAITILGPDFDKLKEKLNEVAEEQAMAVKDPNGRPKAPPKKPTPEPPPRSRGNFSSSW